MKYFLPLILILTILLSPTLIFGQRQQINSLRHDIYDVIKTKKSEQFIFPYTASNNDRKHPLVYTYDKPKSTNWILSIENDMSYTSIKGAKTVIRLQEPLPSEKFIEIAMFGDTSKRFWAAVNTKDSGYIRIYEKNVDGWSTDQPIIVGYADNQGLSVTNGKRIIVDRLPISGFTLSSIAVYGKDDSMSPSNTYAGYISFNLIFGDPADSPIFYLPLGMLIGTGAILIGLLVFKKRARVSAETK
jgi:hypothetical protein